MWEHWWELLTKCGTARNARILFMSVLFFMTDGSREVSNESAVFLFFAPLTTLSLFLDAAGSKKTSVRRPPPKSRQTELMNSW